MEHKWRCGHGLALCVGLLSWSVSAAQWQINVVDNLGHPLPDAVVEIIPTAAGALENAISKQAPGDYQIIQQYKQFQPFVLAIPVGAEVDFPNLDATRHHVYSFSKAKTFEIKLYKDRPHSPILFDKPGVVALGCNIHDRMQAHIYVASSPWVAVSDDKGMVEFDALEPANYQVKVWHPWQRRSADIEAITLDGDRSDQFKILTIKPDAPVVGLPKYY